ncbi:hypothetical protein [Ureaplasma parvum]|uniref:hypothetical protein n=1 Tax=Ureaplasma parvum TaxID=134821 RepID=UPI0026EBDCF6|nr:hypothetical protein [Ureaplasma parvum]
MKDNLIRYDDGEIYQILKNEIIDKVITIKELSLYLNINIGTIKRWMQLKKVPKNYFIEINKLINNKYRLDIDENTKYKVYDMFFTDNETAKELIEHTMSFISKNYNLNFNDYTFLEPSAGDGSFYNIFPKEYKKIALDVEPKSEGIAKQDFFTFKPENNNKYIIIGNPPFGLRGQLALKFINYAASFTDFICFVLPPLFNSNGKGSPMLRVDEKLKLVDEISIKNDFYYPNKAKIKIHAIFQIWTKIENEKIKHKDIKNKKSEYIKVIALSNGDDSSKKRNVKYLDQCDFYLPSTTFGEIRSEKCFEKLPNKRGYGIIILKNKENILKYLERIDWKKISFKSTNGANNLRTQLIIDALHNEMEN